eukprot:7684633-Lingulodinium_polyedra.AAC.1
MAEASSAKNVESHSVAARTLLGRRNAGGSLPWGRAMRPGTSRASGPPEPSMAHNGARKGRMASTRPATEDTLPANERKSRTNAGAEAPCSLARRSRTSPKRRSGMETSNSRGRQDRVAPT